MDTLARDRYTLRIRETAGRTIRILRLVGSSEDIPRDGDMGKFPIWETPCQLPEGATNPGKSMTAIQI